MTQATTRCRGIIALSTISMIFILYHHYNRIPAITTLQSYVNETFMTLTGTRCCPLELLDDVASRWKPMVKLNPNRFLLPILKNGPNNQLSGLRDSIYIAIRLNRTIVLPRFFKHRTDEAGEQSISATHRLDLLYLQKLISYVTIEEFRHRCHGNIDAIFRVRNVTMKRYRDYERTIGMKMLNKAEVRLLDDVIEYPVDPQLMANKRILRIGMNVQELRRYYGSQRPCAIYAEPFSNLEVHPLTVKGGEPNRLDVHRMNDLDLFAEIVRFTRAPRHVVNMTSSFLRDVIGNRSYVTVHWRYDKSDWMKSCLQHRANAKRQELCSLVTHQTPADVVRAILLGLATVNGSPGPQSSVVYIATPPPQFKLMEKINGILEQRHNITLYYGRHLHAYMTSQFKACDWLSQNLNDILSTIEMEICVNSRAFFRAQASTWSNNVVLARRGRKLDQQFLNLIQHSKKSTEKFVLPTQPLTNTTDL